MGFLDWWRKRARVDPTAVDTHEDVVQIVRAPDEDPPAGLADACAAQPEVRSAYLFHAERGGAAYLVLGIVLDDAVSDERMAEIARDLERAADPLRLGVEAVGPETLRDVQAHVAALFEREPNVL